MKPFISSPARNENFRFLNSLDRNVNKETSIDIRAADLNFSITRAYLSGYGSALHITWISNLSCAVTWSKSSSRWRRRAFYHSQKGSLRPHDREPCSFFIFFSFFTHSNNICFPFLLFIHRERETHTLDYEALPRLLSHWKIRKTNELREICPPTQHMNTKFKENTHAISLRVSNNFRIKKGFWRCWSTYT